MSTPEKTNHWKSLAALLGTESAGEPEPGGLESLSTSSVPPAPAPAPVQEKKPSPPRPPAPPAPTRTAPPKPAVPKRSHWGKLANVLGLGGSPVPEPEVEPEPEIEQKRVFETERQPITPPPDLFAPASQNSEAAEMAASHWDNPERDQDRGIDPLEMVTEPFVDEALDAVDLDSIEGQEPTGEASADERRRRRRRRRGRGRGRHGGPDVAGDRGPERSERGPDRPERQAEPPVIAADAVTDAGADLDDLDEQDVREDVEHGDRAEVAREDGPREEDREEGGQRRRRRRRRGRRGRRDETETTSQERPAESGPRARSEGPASRPPSEDSVRKRDTHMRRDAEEEIDHLDDDDSMEDMDRDEDLGDDMEGKDDDLHLSHKKIPSWFEAIEAVITTNMTSRANNPSSGNRNRGGGRGRRDR